MSELQSLSCKCCRQSSTRVNDIYHHLTEADAPIAMAYVPYQPWETASDLCHALNAGTIFSALNKPFCGKGGKCR